MIYYAKWKEVCYRIYLIMSYYIFIMWCKVHPCLENIFHHRKAYIEVTEVPHRKTRIFTKYNLNQFCDCIQVAPNGRPLF